ncbi:type A von Willebrand factor domain-containing protein [Heterostelium album PN500]|uniref:Type A von Willebrand factor domain-containing protein n=1 Tax=Heterostelium pallidum (strain ATCC 26659 / Pp 5 / PN500) TaxID=670386 RepID=D3BTA2_HETP5|nr:type A von Willebrand factor domain-containing protein [Heterostelium album PN500]EFA75319.1 type A von Willebrand factor domain-containing protein [Heterostelium album PN500]|eukprot:XP_020427453.1 type A von Willebrand factor domain-containing protein [Heterostelium album PN500]
MTRDTTHFRYGSLSWKTTSDPKVYSFSLKVAFRYSYFNESGNGVPQVGESMSYGNVKVQYLSNCYFCNPQQYKTNFLVDHIDYDNDWLTAEYAFTIDFNGQYDLYVSYHNSERLSTLNNNARGDWNIATRFNMEEISNLNISQVEIGSPVTGLLPVVNAYVGQTNRWRIPAVDPVNEGITYSFSSESEMPGVQPSGMSISPDGIVSFTPTQEGVFCSQVNISKSYPFFTYTVVDYMINVTKPSGFTGLPPVFIDPTPSPNKILTVVANDAVSIIIVGQSPQPTSSVFISIGNLPDGMTTVSQTNSPTNIEKLVFNWKPTTSQAGIYVITLGLVDSQGLQLAGGVQSFSLNVTLPECGNGKKSYSGTTCICYPGWAGKQCIDCDTSYFGSSCQKTPECINGKSNDGIYGDGQCVCDHGWIGSSCNISLVRRCSTSESSYIVTESTSDSSNFQSSSVQIYLNRFLQTTPPLVVQTKFVKSPQSIPLDLYFVLDVSSSPSISNLYNQFQKIYPDFESYLVPYIREKAKFGFGYFSDSENQPNSFQLISVLNNSIKNEIKSISLSSGLPQPNIQYQALIDAASTVSWSTTGSLKMMILVTDNDLAPTNSSLIPTLKSILAKQNILLGVFSMDIVTSYTNWMTPDIGIASSWSTTSIWYRELISNIIVPMGSQLQTSVVGDQSFVSSGPTEISTGLFESSFNYPETGEPVSTPTVSINVVGYGKQTIQIAYNHPPTTTSTIVNLQMNDNRTFSIPTNDIDENILSIQFKSIPSQGVLLFNESQIVIDTPYQLPTIQSSNIFRYIPNEYYFGVDQVVYTIDDGCTSANGQVNFEIAKINLPPVCNPKTIATDQFTEVQFSIESSDFEGDLYSLKFGSLAGVGAIGVITENDIPVNQVSQYSNSSTFVFKPLETSINTNISIPIQVFDINGFSSQCALTIVINRINVPPTINVDQRQLIVPTGNLTIPFSVTDMDPDEELTVTLTTINPKNGAFYDSNGKLIKPIDIPYDLEVFNNVQSASSFFFYKAANFEDTGVSFTIQVMDKAGVLDSEKVSITVNGSRANSPPKAFKVGDLYLLQDKISSVFTLNGSDTDGPLLDPKLSVVISSPPKFGQLLNDDGVTPISNQNYAPLRVIYKPNPGYYGNDNLIYYLEDSMAAQSNQVNVNFNVKFVNHPPYVNAPNLTLYRSNDNTEVSLAFTIIATDVDQDDPLSVRITSFPSYGSLLYLDGSPINGFKKLKDLNIQFIVPETINYDFTTDYTVEVCDSFDACYEDIGTIVYSYTTIRNPPTCRPTPIYLNQLNPINFVLKGFNSDPSNKMKIALYGLRSLVNFGQIMSSTTNSLVKDGDRFDQPATFTFKPETTTHGGVIILPFVVFDSSNLTAQCTLLINVTRVYVPPIISISRQITMNPDTLRTIPFSIFNYNYISCNVTVSITAINSGGGSFFDGSKHLISNDPYKLGDFQIVKDVHDFASGLSYKSINGQYTANFTIKVVDDRNGTDSKNVSIVVAGNVKPYPPVAIPVPMVSTLQNQQSLVIILNGSHPFRPYYNGSLTIYIINFPLHGEVVPDNGATKQEIKLDSPASVVYIPNTDYSGTDQFDFYVKDQFGLVSTPETVKITIEKVDYAPTINLNPETILSSTSCGQNIENINISVSVTNHNLMHNLQVKLLQLPANGTILYDGQPIDPNNMPFQFNSSKGLQYLPSKSFHSYNSTYIIEACDRLCSIATGNIVIQYIDSLPQGRDEQYYMKQNQDSHFALFGQDCKDGFNVKFQFLTLPKFGTLYDELGIEINSTSQLQDSNAFSYVPFKDAVSLETNGNESPLESFSYQVINNNSLASQRSYSIEIFVHPIPTYIGESHFTSHEETLLTIPILVSFNGKPYSLVINSFSANGQLYYINSIGKIVYIPSSGLLLNEYNYVLYYMPPKDIYGWKVDTIAFHLNGTYDSDLYLIDIDVTQVFQAPVIVPLTFTKNGTTLPFQHFDAELFVNQSTVITFDVTSRDQSWDELKSFFGSGQSPSGVFCQYDQTVTNFCGDYLTYNSIIKRSDEDQLWRVVYIPHKGRTGLRISQFTIIGQDSINKTTSERIYISVLRINIPPVVILTQNRFNTTIDVPISFNNISVFDPDSTENNNITFTLSLISTLDNELTLDGSIDLPFALESSCNITVNQVNCTNSNDILNRFLEAISVVFKQVGDYQLVVNVNDQGYNSLRPDQNKLSDSKSILISVSQAPNPSKPYKTTIIIVTSIIGGLGLASIVAFSVWRILKSRTPPTEAYFGEYYSKDVSINPLYVPPTNISSGINPLYENKN